MYSTSVAPSAAIIVSKEGMKNSTTRGIISMIPHQAIVTYNQEHDLQTSPQDYHRKYSPRVIEEENKGMQFPACSKENTQTLVWTRLCIH